jgi:alpha-1,6-mannosyltransferase
MQAAAASISQMPHRARPRNGALKTLHLTNAYHPASGGIRTFYTAMMEAANRACRPFRLVVPSDGDTVEDIGAYARIYRVRAPRAVAFDTRYRTIYPDRYLFENTAVANILAREQPDVVEIADKFALNYLGAAIYKGLVKDLRRPLVIGTTNERLDDNIRIWLGDTRFTRAFADWYTVNIYYSCFDHHVAVSEYTADELRVAARKKPRKRAPEIAVLGMGVDASRFSPEYRSTEFRRHLLVRAGWQGNVKLLLYAGRISPEKNLGLLLETMRAIDDPSVRLLVVGSGPQEKVLRQKAAGDSRIRVWGHSSDREWMARLLASADAFVHPNPREPFGIAPLEAMASGTPTVLPNAGGVLTYANPANSWLAAPRAEEFALAVKCALDCGAPNSPRVIEGRATAKRFDWPQVTARYFHHYDEVYARLRGPQVLALAAGA